MTTAATLAELPLFSGFSRDDLNEFADRARIRSFPAGAPLVQQGDLDAVMFVIISGRARVALHAPGVSKEIATVGKGDVVGEISMLTGVARTATVTASEPLSAIEIDKAAFSAVIGGRKPLLEHIAAIVEQRRAELAHVRQESEAADISSRVQILDRLMRLFG